LIKQNELTPPAGARRPSKRVGRGLGSHGTYSGRGAKGQKSRAGYKIRPGFEGGQLPLIKKLPRKRGFTNIFRVEYNTVNIGILNAFDDGSEITPELLLRTGIIKNLTKPVKILADGSLEKALNIKAHKFSASAKAKIEAAGGTAQEVAYATKVE